MNSFVYALCCPTTEAVRYIGQTRRGMSRPITHMQRCRLRQTAGTHRTQWILSVLRQGLMPSIKILEYAAPEDLDAAECFWIAQARGLGWDLTNHTSGGEGLKNPSAATREKIGRIAAARSPSSLERMRRAAQNRPVEVRARTAATLKGNKNALGHRLTGRSLELARWGAAVGRAKRWGHPIPPRPVFCCESESESGE